MSNTKSSFLNIVQGVLLTVAGVALVLLLQHYLFSLKPQPHTSNQEIDKRIQPLATVVISETPKQEMVGVTQAKTNSLPVETANPSSSPSPIKATLASNDNAGVGKKTFESICTGCHSSGALGAPKFANKKDWAPRIAQGMDVLYKSAIKGKNSMPAKGGNPALTDDEVKAAVNYMVSAAK